MKRYIILVNILCCFIVNTIAQNTMFSAVNAGTIRATTSSLGTPGYQHTLNTNNYTNNYNGQSTNDVFYKFTILSQSEVTISHCGSLLGDTYLHLLNSTGTRIAYNDDCMGGCTNYRQARIKKILPGGTYYVVSEGKSSNGSITTNIGAVSLTSIMPNSINAGTHETSFNYSDVKDTKTLTDYYANIGNDAVYRFTLSQPMEVTISHAGSDVQYTSLYLVNMLFNQMHVNHYRSTNPEKSYANITVSLGKGTYYIVSEGYSSDGKIRTSISGKVLPPNHTAAPSNDQNYIITKSATKELTNPDELTLQNSLQGIQYFDGLGRPTISVQTAATPSAKDLAAYIEYDNYGREYRQWLPIPTANNDGSFVNFNDFQTEANNYYSEEGKPYTEVTYENSPLNRIFEQRNPGNSWHQHSEKIDYSTNSNNEVKYYRISTTDNLEKSGYYLENSLYKTITKDEDGNSMTEYKDKQGQVVMTRQSTDHDTYYIYDDFGLLRYVLPPLAADGLSTNGIYADSYDILKKYAYIYKYDGRGRQIIKHLPGCDPIYMVYDKADRLLFTQDGNQRQTSLFYNWTLYKYDIQGRMIYSYQINLDESHEELIEYAKDRVITEYFNPDADYRAKDTGYTKGYWHAGSSELLTVNYYDNYDDYMDLLPENLQSELIYRDKEGYGKRYPNAKDMLTATKSYLLDGSTNYLITCFYYDYMGRLIQTRATNHLGGYDNTYNEYDFAGNILQSYKEHSVAESDELFTEHYSYKYDHTGRLTDTQYSRNNANPVSLAKQQYDETGRLVNKQQHNNINAITYDYNIRNWLTKIKNGKFEQNLDYHDSPHQMAETYYNGNISSTSWKHDNQTCTYIYNYDELSRLTNALAPSETTFGPHYEEAFTYDKHGNILNLRRRHEFSLVSIPGVISNGGILDNLVMDYDGNQLIKVTDTDGGLDSNDIKEYRDYSNLDQEFYYDKNGNLIEDSDREIRYISYNLLNLPERIVFNNGNIITNLYAADGRKLISRYEAMVPQVILPGLLHL